MLPGMVSPLDSGHHCIISLIHKHQGHDHKLWSWSHHPCSSQGEPPVTNPRIIHRRSMLWVGQNAQRIVEHAWGLYNQPGGCGPSLHPRASLQTVFLILSFFNHPGQEHCMTHDVSCLFNLSDTHPLAHMYVAHPQPIDMWKISFCIISMLHRNLCERALLRMRDSRVCTRSGLTSLPPCWSILITKIPPFLASKSSKSMGTGSNTPSIPISEWTNLGNSPYLSHGEWL